MPVHRGVLFDLDGVIVNTESLKLEAHAEIARRLGGRLPEDFYPRVMGNSREAVAQEAIRLASIDVSVEDYNRALEAFLVESLPGLAANVGVIEVLHDLRTRRYRTALVSSSSRDLVDDVLRRAGLGQSFDLAITAEDVARPKPFPDSYLAALRGLSLSPRQAIAFEDSAAGLAAARAAELPVVAVIHPLNRGQNLSGAQAQIASFQDRDGIVRLVESLLDTSRP